MGLVAQRRAAAAVIAVAAGILSMSFAAAAPITRTFTFAATDWTPVGTIVAAPVDPVAGSFTLTFDPAGAVVLDMPLTMSGLALPVASILVTVNSGQAGRLLIGGTLNGVGSLQQGADDFFLQISAAHTAAPQLDAVIYTHASDAEGVWFANDRRITFVEGGSVAVPAPAALGLFALGLLSLGRARRRRAATAAGDRA